MKESDDIEFAGVFEPSLEVRETLGQGPIYDGVHWVYVQRRNTRG